MADNVTDSVLITTAHLENKGGGRDRDNQRFLTSVSGPEKLVQRSYDWQLWSLPSRGFLKSNHQSWPWDHTWPLPNLLNRWKLNLITSDQPGLKHHCIPVAPQSWTRPSGMKPSTCWAYILWEKGLKILRPSIINNSQTQIRNKEMEKMWKVTFF